MRKKDRFEGEFDLSADRGVIDQNDPINVALREELIDLMCGNPVLHGEITGMAEQQKVAPSFIMDLMIKNIFRPRYEQEKITKIIREQEKKK